MSVPYLLFAYKSLPSGMDSRIKKRASADTQNGHRQRLLVRFPGIQASAEIDTYFRAKEETAQGIRNRQISRRMDTHGIIVVERFATFHYH